MDRSRTRSFCSRALLISLAIAMSPASSNSAPAPGCPAGGPIADYLMNPLAIQAWLKTSGSAVKSIDQFVCCLPEKYRSNFIVGHSSLAAQNGIPISPRVIVFDNENKREDELKVARFFALSMNGGHPSLIQNKNVEMAYLNPKSNELEFFDLEFPESGTPQLSNKNPESCMSCHGLDGKYAAGGPRPIFDPFARWNRFVGGRGSFCSLTEKKYFSKVEDIAVKAVESNPRFKCLDKSIFKKRKEDPRLRTNHPDMFRKIDDFDVSLAVINSERIPRLIRSYRIFQRIKYGLFGLNVCGGSFADWFPHDVAQKIYSKAAIWEDLRGKDWKARARDRLRRQVTALKQNDARMTKAVLLNDIPSDRPLVPPPIIPLQCAKNEQLAQDEMRISEETPNRNGNRLRDVDEDRSSDEDLDLMARLDVQKQLLGVRGDRQLMLIFDSLGEDTGFWNRSPTGTNSQDPVFPMPVDVLESEYAANSKFREDIGKFFDVKPRASMDEVGRFSLGGKNEIEFRENFDSCGEYKKWVQAQNAASVPSARSTKASEQVK